MEWISVKDKLPKMGQDVIVAIEDPTEPDCAKTVMPLVFCVEGHGYGFHCFTVGGVIDYSEGITHWMPLPDPPSE